MTATNQEVYYSFRLKIVGDSGVGKSSIV
jgi:GTPase SAR1 family protein